LKSKAIVEGFGFITPDDEGDEESALNSDSDAPKKKRPAAKPAARLPSAIEKANVKAKEARDNVHDSSEVKNNKGIVANSSKALVVTASEVKAEEEKDAEVAHEDYTLAVTELQIGVKFKRAAEVKQEVDSLAKESGKETKDAAVESSSKSKAIEITPEALEEAPAEVDAPAVFAEEEAPSMAEKDLPAPIAEEAPAGLEAAPVVEEDDAPAVEVKCLAAKVDGFLNSIETVFYLGEVVETEAAFLRLGVEIVQGRSSASVSKKEELKHTIVLYTKFLGSSSIILDMLLDAPLRLGGVLADSEELILRDMLGEW
jgi:hypothetical protein